MANMNIRTPRFYTDLISYNITRGVAQNGNYDIQATNSGNNLVGITDGGGSEMDLFDLRPLNQVTFNTSRTATEKADHVVITLDMLGDSRINFVAILNHNLTSCTGKIRVSASDTKSHVEEADFGSATAIDCSGGEIVNADTISSNIINPATDGSTIFTFSESHLRYWGIQFEGVQPNFSSTSLKVGSIIVGKYYDMPNSPDLNVKRTIAYDNNKITESLGGQKYGHMINLGRTATSTSKSPFATASNKYNIHGGKIQYDMSFSYLNSTDVMPDEYHTVQHGDSNFISDVWNIIDGNHRPFIFSADNGSTGDSAESEHIFARFDQNKLDMSQVAPDVFNMKLKIKEEF